MKNETLSQDLLRSLALMQHNGEDYFICVHNGIPYEGTAKDANTAYTEYLSSVNASNLARNKEDQQQWLNFAEWCEENLTEVEEYNTEDYNNDYLVLTDEEADEKAKEYILDSVWAFTPSFLASFTGFDIEVFEAIQNNGRCESNNAAILSMIEDEDDFVSDAISADGRGHFMSTYDGEENEEEVNGETFYIYRIN